MGRQNAQVRRQKRQARIQKKKAADKKKQQQQQAAEEASEAREDDIDAILRQIEQEDKSADVTKPREIACKAPTSRYSCGLVAHPTSDELLLHGGEFCNGRKTLVYKELFSYSIKKNEWKELRYPNPPPRRSGHQCVITPRAGGELWVFGGEFISPSGGQFRHYNDLWVLNLKDKVWEQVEAPNPPHARSGHRMVLIKKCLVVFGGFFDNARKAPKYFNDVHVFDLETRTWHALGFPPTIPCPEPRSACQFVTDGEKALVVGGYAKIRAKGEHYQGHTYDDMWTLTTEAAEDDAEATASDGKKGNKDKQIACGLKWTWERARSSTGGPAARAGSVAAVRNNQIMYSFGGVCDEETEDHLQGTFFDELYSLHLPTMKWKTVTVKNQASSDTSSLFSALEKKTGDNKKKPRRRRKGQGVPSDKASASADPSETSSAKAQDNDSSDSSSSSSSDSDSDSDDKGSSASSARSTGKSMQSRTPQAPTPRMGSAFAIKGNTLFVFGGMTEVGDRQITFSDFYSLDLAKLNSWNVLVPMRLKTIEWLEEESSSEDEEDGEDDADS